MNQLSTGESVRFCHNTKDICGEELVCGNRNDISGNNIPSSIPLSVPTNSSISSAHLSLQSQMPPIPCLSLFNGPHSDSGNVPTTDSSTLSPNPVSYYLNSARSSELHIFPKLSSQCTSTKSSVEKGSPFETAPFSALYPVLSSNPSLLEVCTAH